ncbi:hypothetical protein, partial [Undibacterium sp. TC9W]|uniref:hypothetical protein n=1 Tax=Undibacterium sp. TC9W TaxID=3413053 RepID=UPI003BF38483
PALWPAPAVCFFPLRLSSFWQFLIIGASSARITYTLLFTGSQKTRELLCFYSVSLLFYLILRAQRFLTAVVRAVRTTV